MTPTVDIQTGVELVRRTKRGVISSAFLANLLGGAILFVFLQWLTYRGKDPNSSLGLTLVAIFGIVASGLMFRAGPKLYTRTTEWLSAGRVPTAEERLATLTLPARLAAHFFAYWATAALFFGSIDAFSFHSEVLRTIQVACTTLLGGLTTCMVFFLIVERQLRPIFALALSEGGLSSPATIGIRPRLLLTWALGSGVVLASLLLLPVANAGHAHVVGSMVFLAITGLVAGFVLTSSAARSVADPVEDVRAGLRSVQAGDLSVRVTVNDGGEVGLLQAGFNDMVTGLQERVLLRDLLGRHIGDEAARYALEHGVGLGGEIRDVSVLFVDVIGSTGLAQTRPATEVVALLNTLFQIVVRAVTAEGGWINKFEGDAAMCVFGAPDHQPDHAERALAAALHLHKDLTAWAADGGLDAAIGVSSGTVVAGNIGSEERYEYTVIGDPVNEAARLSDLAKTSPGRVLASGRSAATSGGHADWWKREGSVVLRGRIEETDLFAPLGSSDNA